MRIFLDANVLFSASKSNGAIRELVRRLVAEGHECVVDDYVVFEARRNLAAKGPESIETFELLITQLSVAPVVPEHDEPHRDLSWLAEKDRPVLASAQRLRCEALVTGDRTHFGMAYGRKFAGVTIHSPRSLAELLFGY